MKCLSNKFLKMPLLQSYEMALLHILGSETHRNHKKNLREKFFEMPLLQIEGNASPTNPTKSVTYKSYEISLLKNPMKYLTCKSYEIPVRQILRYAIATFLRNDTYTILLNACPRNPSKSLSYKCLYYKFYERPLLQIL